MITVQHRKTYTLNLEITPRDSLYEMFRDAYDNAESDPFKRTNEIFDFIKKEIKPLVPFKKVSDSCGYRLHTSNADRFIGCLVTYHLSSEEIDFIH